MDDKRTPSVGHHHQIRGLRVSILLLLVALIPLAGVATLTWNAIDDAHAVTDAASRTDHLAQTAVLLAELDASVFDEMVWTAMNSVITTLDTPASVTEQVMGVDPVAQLLAASGRTDELTAASDEAYLLEALGAARSPQLDLRGILREYGSIATSVEASLSAILSDVTASATGSAGAKGVSDNVRALELAVNLREIITQEFYGYFATIFDVRGTPAEEIAGLVGLRLEFSSVLVALQAAGADTPQLSEALDVFATDPIVSSLTQAVDGLIARSLDEGLPSTGAPVSLPVVLANVEGFTDVMEATIASSTAVLTVLGYAVDGVLSASLTVQAAADDDIRRVYVLAGTLMLASLLTALLAARFIVRPLRGLRKIAEELQANQERTTSHSVGGPTEVKAAARAIQDAAVHFDLVTRQARALAAGVLDASVLDEEAQGGLGVALQNAVGTLRTALAQQDEFRRRLAHEAAHDGLTQLANRNASMAQLSRSLARTTRSGGTLAVLFIDLDRFKDVNDMHGHQAGDAVLTTVAQRLVNSVREGDHVGRLGGDEFVVIAEPVESLDATVELAERILDKLSEPIDVATARVSIGASIGIAIAEGDHLTADELLRDADLAVYRAKTQGRGGIEICNEDLRNDLAETTDLTLAIRKAICNDELRLHYQPIVDTLTGGLHAFEALVRWQRPGQDQLVPPDDFIAFAERSALIIDIDRWVMNAVMSQIANWTSDGEYIGVPVAVNVSGRHLADDGFVQHVLQPLTRYGIDPSRIIVEVTESALLDDLTSAAVKLQQLRDAGILVAIDDFGTGYTSLAHLRSLPVDILKIDRSFTANAATDSHEASIVKLIIDTGHLLGATITAEGVETAGEAAKLAVLGSDNLQGFYFARPQPSDQLMALPPPRTIP